MLESSVKENMVWESVWITIIWSIWLYRNNIIFRNNKIEAEKNFNLAQVNTGTGIINKYPEANFFYSD